LISLNGLGFWFFKAQCYPAHNMKTPHAKLSFCYYQDMTDNESEVRAIIENWAKAVRQRDIDGILANHADDIVMYDIPPPFESKGVEAYRNTWDTFFKWSKDSGVFDITELNIVAGDDVAFAYASMKCMGYTESGEEEPLQFRLTVGLEKQDGKWLIGHEHHSIPSD
jgi:uncharacterized protein (TIGR02246 family)